MKTKKLRQDFDDVEDCCFWGRLGQGEKDFRITEVCINCNLELEKVERNALHASPVLPETAHVNVNDKKWSKQLKEKEKEIHNLKKYLENEKVKN